MNDHGAHGGRSSANTLLSGVRHSDREQHEFSDGLVAIHIERLILLRTRAPRIVISWRLIESLDTGPRGFRSTSARADPSAALSPCLSADRRLLVFAGEAAVAEVTHMTRAPPGRQNNQERDVCPIPYSFRRPFFFRSSKVALRFLAFRPSSAPSPCAAREPSTLRRSAPGTDQYCGQIGVARDEHFFSRATTACARSSARIMVRRVL